MLAVPTAVMCTREFGVVMPESVNVPPTVVPFVGKMFVMWFCAELVPDVNVQVRSNALPSASLPVTRTVCDIASRSYGGEKRKPVDETYVVLDTSRPSRVIRTEFGSTARLKLPEIAGRRAIPL